MTIEMVMMVNVVRVSVTIKVSVVMTIEMVMMVNVVTRVSMTIEMGVVGSQ